MKRHSSIIIAPFLLMFLASCTSVMQNSARGYETKQLKSVIVAKRSFNVEERTRVFDESKPPVGENKTIAVYAKVNGKLVYCGSTRSGCKKAIIEELKKSGHTEFEGGD